MSVTLKDVAREAGVSLMTVSRVVNNKGDIAEATRENVLKAIEKLNYTPNRIARSLVVNKSDFIAIIVPDIANPFFSEMVKGAEKHARDMGYNIILGDTEGLVDNEIQCIDMAIGRKADGIILVAPRIKEEVICQINELVPLIIIDRYVPNEDVIQVYVDNLRGAKEAVEYLIELGHRRIGFISGPRDVGNSLRREEGYRRALAHHGIPLDPDLVVVGDFHYQSGYDSFDHFMQIEPRPTAIFASNDLMAVGVIQRARQRGLHVPRDVSVVGFDDIFLASVIDPPLTTVRHPMLEMGTRASALLVDRLDQRRDKQMKKVLENKLVIRKSATTLSK